MPSPLKPMNQLPLKHQLFILGYLEHKGDKTKAARHAGYAPKRAAEQGSQLYRKLQDYIAPLVGELVRGHALHAEQVVQGLSLLASSDIGDYCSWNKKNEVIFKDMSELTPAQRFCVESIEQRTTQWGNTITFRLTKKQPALETLALYHNLLKRPMVSKGLFVSFEDGTVHGNGKVSRDVVEHTRRKVEVTFEDVAAGPTMKKGNGHGHG